MGGERQPRRTSGKATPASLAGMVVLKLSSVQVSRAALVENARPSDQSARLQADPAACRFRKKAESGLRCCTALTLRNNALRVSAKQEIFTQSVHKMKQRYMGRNL